MVDEMSDNERIQYQSRIIEIMLNVDVQLKERQRIFEAVNKLDREITQLNGSLGRTYTVVDGWMLNVAGRDGQLQKAYRNLVTMHEMCQSIRKIIEECGSTSREMDDLTDEVCQSMIKLEKYLEKMVHVFYLPLLYFLSIFNSRPTFRYRILCNINSVREVSKSKKFS